tara:strand:+ start:2229 stop:2975 length:747 start_codon:yes stop_codon:yes gene_type:complete
MYTKINDMRTLVVGDIHGALKSLEDVLLKCNYNIDEDRIIFLGDYVDGWGESAEVVDYLIGIKDKAGDKAIFIRGNHDVWAQEWLNYGWSPIMWTQQGGQATLDSYVRTGFLVEKFHKYFFNNLEDWFIDEDNNIYIHGGWAYREADFPKSANWKCNVGLGCHWDRSLLAGAKSASVSQHGFKATKQFNKVFLGHTATASHLPEKFGNLWAIDSGGGWSGKLTIMDVDTEEYWQSDYSKNHYPDEKGR